MNVSLVLPQASFLVALTDNEFNVPQEDLIGIPDDALTMADAVAAAAEIAMGVDTHVGEIQFWATWEG